MEHAIVLLLVIWVFVTFFIYLKEKTIATANNLNCDNEKTTETSCFLYLRISCQILIPAHMIEKPFSAWISIQVLERHILLKFETDAVWEHRNLSCMCDMGFYIYQQKIGQIIPFKLYFITQTCQSNWNYLKEVDIQFHVTKVGKLHKRFSCTQTL